MHIKKNILITGGAGFVGSSIAIYIKKKYPQYTVTCLDNLKRRGSELNLPRLAALDIRFVHGDIRNREDLYLFEAGLTTIIEASAEPSVLAGIGSAPDYLVNTNLMGTINCLYLAAKVKADLIFISTSRVYPIAKIEEIQFSENDTRFIVSHQQQIKGVSEKGIAEDFPIEGSRSLYGATKLCSEFLVQEFHSFYGVRTVINRCGVITGPWQMGKADQGVVVLWVARHFWKQDLAYFGYGGKGKQVRDILHVDDLCRLIDYQMQHPDEMNGRLFNVGGGVEISVSLKELTAICERVTGNQVAVREVKEDRAADIRLYLTDNSAVTAATDWKPTLSVTQMVTDIYHWIKDNEALLKPILAG
ncbi:MAG TPA: NAD-dependent epimerase/dehydratase family protein [Puia sp.]|nr:NAD-dependent epimerase/dehydratase family protein [Puia sp.]